MKSAALQQKQASTDQVNNAAVRQQQKLTLKNNVPHHSFSGFPIQTKLTIGSPNDKYEREADVMADKVMQMSANETMHHQNPMTGLIRRSVQRKCSGCEIDKKKKTIMRKAENGNRGMQVSSSFASSLNASKGGGSPLPKGTRDFMGTAFSTDFSKVRIHSGREATQMSKGINAKAFTNGNDIYFNEGQYNPESSEGKKLLGHELTHVLQQTEHQLSQVQRQEKSQETQVKFYKYNNPLSTYTYLKMRSPETWASLAQAAKAYELTLQHAQTSTLDLNPLWFAMKFEFGNSVEYISEPTTNSYPDIVTTRLPVINLVKPRVYYLPIVDEDLMGELRGLLWDRVINYSPEESGVSEWIQDITRAKWWNSISSNATSEVLIRLLDPFEIDRIGGNGKFVLRFELNGQVIHSSDGSFNILDVDKIMSRNLAEIEAGVWNEVAPILEGASLFKEFKTFVDKESVFWEEGYLNSKPQEVRDRYYELRFNDLYIKVVEFLKLFSEYEDDFKILRDRYDNENLIEKAEQIYEMANRDVEITFGDAIDTYNSLGFMGHGFRAGSANIMGASLFYLYSFNFERVHKTLDDLNDDARDNFSLGFVSSAKDQDLVSLATSSEGRKLLDRMYAEMMSGWVGDAELEQGKRIVKARASNIPIDEFLQAEKQPMMFPVKNVPILPWKQYAPIHAELLENGNIYVDYPVGSSGMSEFSDDFETLGNKYKFELSPDQIVGIKNYDEGGKPVYLPALSLLGYSAETNMDALSKGGEAFILGLTLGFGGLATGSARGVGWAAKTFRWLDGAATALEVLTLVIDDYRGWILKRWPQSGERFLRAVDITTTVLGIYGLSRIGYEGIKLVKNLSKSKNDWLKEVHKSQLDPKSQLDVSEQRKLDELVKKTDGFLSGMGKWLDEWAASPTIGGAPMLGIGGGELMAGSKSAWKKVRRNQLAKGFAREYGTTTNEMLKIFDELDADNFRHLDIALRQVEIAEDIASRGRRTSIDEGVTLEGVEDFDKVETIEHAQRGKTARRTENTRLEKITSGSEPLPVALAIPKGKYNEELFQDWFDNLSLEEFRKIWADDAAKKAIGDMIREPGGFHEWLKVSQLPKIKEWKLSMKDVHELRTRTYGTVGKNFRHVATDPKYGQVIPGYGRMHQELDKMFDKAKDFPQFKQLLNDWADVEMAPLGRAHLPEGLQLPQHKWPSK